MKSIPQFTRKNIEKDILSQVVIIDENTIELFFNYNIQFIAVNSDIDSTHLVYLSFYKGDLYTNCIELADKLFDVKHCDNYKILTRTWQQFMLLAGDTFDVYYPYISKNILVDNS